MRLIILFIWQKIGVGGRKTPKVDWGDQVTAVLTIRLYCILYSWKNIQYKQKTAAGENSFYLLLTNCWLS